MTFAERFPDFLAPNAQRTERLTTALEAVAFALGGQAGSRLTPPLKMPTSGDTLLRIIRRTPTPATPKPEIVGVDDWAYRRGRVYGTLLVDLERHQAIELLDDRTAETLATWLKAHTQVKVIARDRSTEYARGITLGAPQAQQVADRWHLLVNLRDAFQRLLDRLRTELQLIATAKLTANPGDIPRVRVRQRSADETAARDAARARRLALHAKVHRLRRAGHSVKTIGRQLKMSRMTVYRYLSFAEYPERIAKKRPPGILGPYVGYLTERWKAGCRNASQLWREIEARGYPGSRRQVSRWVADRREQPAPTTPTKYRSSNVQSAAQLMVASQAADKPPLPVSRQLVWLFLKHAEQLETDELRLRDVLLTHPVIAKTSQLAHDFQRLVRQRKHRALDSGLETCKSAGIPELANLAAGLGQDYSAVKAAITLEWSNGQTEGQVNRLKLLKRQMYGRAGLDLLRLRFLHPA